MNVGAKARTNGDILRKAEKAIDEAISTFASANPFIHSLGAQRRIIVSWKVPTAAVTKASIMFNPDFFLNLPSEGRVFIVAHEFMHIAFRHLDRVGGRDPVLWNIACDVVVNEMLKETMEVPRGLITADMLSELLNVDPNELRKMSAEEIYELLKKKVEAGIDVVERLKEMIPREYWGMLEDLLPGLLPEGERIVVREGTERPSRTPTWASSREIRRGRENNEENRATDPALTEG